MARLSAKAVTSNFCESAIKGNTAQKRSNALDRPKILARPQALLCDNHVTETAGGNLLAPTPNTRLCCLPQTYLLPH
jgi:hypothetical protein